MTYALGAKNRANKEWKLTFRVEEAWSDIVLSCDAEEVGRVRIEPNRELLEKLLPTVDGFLAEHALDPSDIADVRVESNLPDGYSSRRIAETVAGVWKWNRFEFGR